MHRFEGTGEVCDHCGTSKWNSVHFPAGGKDYRVLENESLREQLAALTAEVEEEKQKTLQAIRERNLYQQYAAYCKSCLLSGEYDPDSLETCKSKMQKINPSPQDER